jgi:hypothetical protein
MLHPKMDRYKLYEMACDECKEEWLKENNNEQVVFRAE